MKEEGLSRRYGRPMYSFNVTEEKQDKEIHELKLKDFQDGFATSTGLHGIPKSYHANSYIKKFVWTVATFGMLVVCIYNVALNIQTLLAWDVTVSVDITSVRELPFPAVTVCNLNSLRLSAIPAELLAKLQDSSLTSSVQDQGPGDFGSTTGLGTSKSSKLSTQEVITEELRRSSPSELLSYGYGLRDLILSCSYSGYDCTNPENWQHTYNWRYGNCYVFNVNQSLSQLLSVRPGPNYGLTLVLNTDISEYVPILSDMVGARVDVHSSVDMPFPDEVGVNVAPGTSTGIGLRKVDITRLGDKYSVCRDSSLQSYEENVYEEIYTWTNYSLAACQKTCWQKMVIEQCGCFDANYPSQGVAFTNSQTSPCSSYNSTQSQCKEQVRTVYLSDTSCQQCIVACNQSSYSMTLSTAAWPASTYKQTLLSSLDPSLTSVQKLNNGTMSVSENLMQVEIYFEELNYEAITETAAYSEAMFMSDLGGAFGLWLGASVLSVVEVLEFLMDITAFVIHKACRGTHKTHAVDLGKMKH